MPGGSAAGASGATRRPQDDRRPGEAGCGAGQIPLIRAMAFDISGKVGSFAEMVERYDAFVR